LVLYDAWVRLGRNINDDETKILTANYDQVLFFRKGIRGGYSQCRNRHAKANNIYMGEQYDVSKEAVFIEYLYAINLYGWAISICRMAD
jgi:hypothetical protein